MQKWKGTNQKGEGEKKERERENVSEGKNRDWEKSERGGKQ